MKPQAKADPITTKLNEMEATCRLWIAVNAAKDDRIRELETELHALQQRVARLGRQACRRSDGAMLGARIRSAR